MKVLHNFFIVCGWNTLYVIGVRPMHVKGGVPNCSSAALAVRNYMPDLPKFAQFTTSL